LNRGEGAHAKARATRTIREGRQERRKGDRTV
jgi:hypothetical protein